MRVFWLVLLAMSTSFAMTASALALQVKPLVHDMGVIGSQSRKVITVVNDSDADVPMELVINRLDIGPNGEAIRSPGGEEDFIIFPPQTVIPAGKTQSFRVQWIGDPDLPESRSYNISVNQLPVEISGDADDGAQVQLVYNILTTVTVQPAEGTFSFELRSAEATTGEDGKPAVALTIENTGNTHNYLSNATVSFSAPGWERTLSPQEMYAVIGPGLVLPRHTRRILVSVPDMPYGLSAVGADIRFAK